MPELEPTRGRTDIQPGKYLPIHRFCRLDAVVILVVLFFAAAVTGGLFYSAKSQQSSTSRLEAVLSVDGKEVWRASLSDIISPVEYTVTGTSEKLVVRAEKGRVRVLSSTCRDQVCVHTGWLSGVGQTAVCLPYHVILRVIAVDNGGTAGSTNGSFDVISK